MGTNDEPFWRRNRWLHELRQGDNLLGTVKKIKGRNLWLWHVRRPPSTSGVAESYAAAKRQVEELCGLIPEKPEAK